MAAKRAGYSTISCDVRQLNDIESTIIMVDSNMQRETILPSEKAWAYKYKVDALKEQGKRTDLTSGQVVLKLKNAREIVADESGENYRMITRFIRLTHLINSLLDKVDDKQLAFMPAVELSYLSEQEQTWLNDILTREENFSVPHKLAIKLKGISQNGNLTYEKIDNIIVVRNHEPPKAIKVKYKTIEKFFPPDTTPKEYEEIIQKALTEYFKNHPIKKENQNLILER